MKEIGKTLKYKREQMNLSLSDVHKATRVQEKYLVSIEEGDLDVFKAEVYYKSFLRSYSKYLGFDPEEFVDLFNAQKSEMERASKAEEKSFSNFSNKQVKNIFDIKKILIVVTAIVPAVLLIVFVCLYRHISRIAQPGEANVFRQFEDESLTKQSVEGKVAVFEQEGSSSEENTPVVEVSTKQNLEVEAKETVWVMVDIDGRTAYEGTLSKGIKKIWEADKSFTLKLGYVPGVKVFFNGEPVDVISGAVQDVNTVVLNKKQ
jgi:cytoskeletal protein RodZ